METTELMEKNLQKYELILKKITRIEKYLSFIYTKKSMIVVLPIYRELCKFRENISNYDIYQNRFFTTIINGLTQIINSIKVLPHEKDIEIYFKKFK